MNQYPLGTNLLVLFVVVAGLILALPNIFGADPAVQIGREDGAPVTETTVAAVNASLDQLGIEHQAPQLENERVLVRFPDEATQKRASEVIGDTLDGHIAAMTFAPRTPQLLKTLLLKPMSLGLDLRGGVHFVFEVDLATGISQYLERYAKDLRDQLPGRADSTHR